MKPRLIQGLIKRAFPTHLWIQATCHVSPLQRSHFLNKKSTNSERIWADTQIELLEQVVGMIFKVAGYSVVDPLERQFGRLSSLPLGCSGVLEHHRAGSLRCRTRHKLRCLSESSS